MNKKYDRFHEDIAKVNQQEDRIREALEQRFQASKRGEQTGKYDYLLNNGVESLKDELKNMEKLEYIYKNEPHNTPDIGAKEREKRLAKIRETRERVIDLMSRVKVVSNT